MPNFEPTNPSNVEDSSTNAYNLLFLVTGVVIISSIALTKLVKASNRLNYDSQLARTIAGLINLMMVTLHTTAGDLEIVNNGKKLIAIGPHRTGLDGFVVASKITGTPPRFFVTDDFNKILGVRAFLELFNMITVKANAKKSENGKSGNAEALERASEALTNNGCVALLPQGNFSKLNAEPHRIYSGAAILATEHKIPINVIRLDGFWSLQNPLIPLFIRNNKHYRAIFCLFLHMNNIRATSCGEINVHLLPENQDLSDDKKIELINAELYAFFRHTEELSVEQIDMIKPEIADKRHLLIWENKCKRDRLQKDLNNLKDESVKLEEPTSLSIRTGSR